MCSGGVKHYRGEQQCLYWAEIRDEDLRTATP